MHRREVLLKLQSLAAALAAQSLIPATTASASSARAEAPRADPFTLGVASGQARHDSVVLWTRLVLTPQAPNGGMEPRSYALRWQLAHDEHFATVVREGVVAAPAADAHSVRIHVQGLEAERVYFYRFMLGDAISPTGRTRTAPHPMSAVRRMRLVLASCQHFEQGYYAAWREVAAQDVDAVLFVGDYIYETSRLHHRLRHHWVRPTDLGSYRIHYAQYKTDPDLRAAHAAHPWILTWDDHEVINDYTGDHPPAEMSDAEFLRLRTAAYKAYFEHMPLSPQSMPGTAGFRIADRYVWGRLAELWTLDTRQFRSPHACETPHDHEGRLLCHCAELADPQRTVLGLEQERWLAQGLSASSRTWKLIGQTTQLSPSGFDLRPMGRWVYSEGWDGYPAARERLLGAIAQPRVTNAVLLGGDVHRHVTAALRAQPDKLNSPVVASEIVCSSITTHGLSELLTTLLRKSNPDLAHCRSDERGYVLLDISPQRISYDFRATAYPVLEHACMHSQARFVIEAGQPVPQAA